jgi:fucose permease
VTGLRERRIAVTAGFFIYALLPGVWAARIPAVQDARGLSVGLLGVCLLAPAVGAVAALPAAGALVSRWGRRRVFAVSSVVMAVALPLLPAAPGVGGFVVALAIFGAAGATLDVALNVEAVDVEQRYERSLLSGMHASWSIGAFAGTGIGIATAAAGVTVTRAFVAVAAVVAAALVVCGRRLSTEHAGRSGPVFARPSARTVRIGVFVFCSLFVESAAADWSAVYLHRSTGVTESSAGVGFAAFAAAMVAGRLVGDRVVDRVGPVQAVRWPAAVGAVTLLVAVATRAAVPGVIGFLVAGAGTAILFPMAMVAAGRDAVDPARAIAASATVGYLGWLLAPAMIGGIATATSLPVGIATAAAFLGLAAGFAGILRPAPAPMPR